MIRLALALILLAAPAAAGTSAAYVTCYDGDTCVLRANVWPDIFYSGAVRLRGIDAPEISGKCQAERDKAIEARDTLRKLLKSGKVEMHDISKDKYGRLLARVTVDGQDVAARMIGLGLARAYSGGQRQPWC